MFGATNQPDRINRALFNRLTEKIEYPLPSLAHRKKLVGLRPMIQDLPDDSWMLSDEISPAFDALEQAGLALDALVKPRHLSVLRELLARRPQLRVVIDHGAKPDIAGGAHSVWASQMRQIAEETGAFCKLSGLATEAGSGWSIDTLKPYTDTLLECFGPRRLMWGSDWPVLNEACDYQVWLDVGKRLTAHLLPTDQDAIFGDTAADFYRID